MKKIYLTTPLYYVNDTPHVGHAYCTVNADILARYHRLFGDDVLFLTGTDEHGQKCQEAALKRGLTPQAHCDEMVVNFIKIWEELNIGYDIFFRTTSETHKSSVQKALNELKQRGDIYASDYEGWYSVSEEIFYTEKELVDGLSPTGRPVQLIKEKNYFFKMSAYQDQLIAHIMNNPHFIMPESKRNEVLGFLRQPLADLCISRPKKRLNWGIELPFDSEYVTYVWFDALLNYAVGVGYQQEDKRSEFERWWHQAGATHLIGKDILTTHAVYWTTMLLGLKLPLPKTIFATGWLLTKDNQKMSKSFGEVVKPLDVKDVVGVDAFRYFLARDIQLGNDAPFSLDLVVNRTNAELANNLGNLLSRSTNLVVKFFSGEIPPPPKDWSGEYLTVCEQTTSLLQKVEKEVRDFSINKGLGHVVELLNLVNQFMEREAPWKMAKTDLNKAGECLYTVLESLRVAASLLQPVMPAKMKSLLEQIGWTKLPALEDIQRWGLLQPGQKIVKAEPLFPRIEATVKETK